MQKILISFLTIFIFTSTFSIGKIPSKKSLPLDDVPNVELKNENNSEYLHDRVVVKLNKNVNVNPNKTLFGINSIDNVLKNISIVSIEKMFPNFSNQNKSQVDISKFYVVKYLSPQSPFTVAKEISQLDEVQYAEPWFIYPMEKVFVPNDPSFSSQWGLTKIFAPEAWDISQGDTNVVIGIVDSGVEWIHPDLSQNIWNNPNEIANNGIDDDNNGYIDDVRGWDFAGNDWQNISQDNNPSPTGSNNNHGTHVAGIASASTNNAIGVSGIGFNCKILPVKCAADNDTRGSGGTGYILTGYQGIVYAALMGADAINCSWGGSGGSQTEQDLINFVTDMGSLVVAAAGNDNSNGFNSPSGYKNVIAVASTNQSDVKSSFSNYGPNVDLCAPGSFIYSTVYPSSYVFWDGTSMASPFVAGLAGLVKSHFPDYTSLQVGEQIRINCNNIDAINPSYVGQLGKGRINAHNALTQTSSPSVRLRSLFVSDSIGGNGNGFPQPAETLHIVTEFQNFLAATSPNATIQLSTTSTYLTITQNTFSIGEIGTLQSALNSESPFKVFVKSNAPQSHKANLKLTITDGNYTDIESFTLLINPTFQTHNINDIQLTLTNNGKIGFFDFPNNTQGSGFIFNGVNYLFEGGLIIGTSPTKLVNVVRNPNNVQDNDFSSTTFYTLTTPGTISTQDGYTFFTDNSAPTANKIGVKIDMYSYAFTDAMDKRYIITQYNIKNTTANILNNLYVGQFFDWDVDNYAANKTVYDATRSTTYAWDTSNTNSVYIGVRALDSASGCRALVNQSGLTLDRAAKWNWISGGFSTTTGKGDIHHVISSGPFSIPSNETQIVAFAIAAGENLTDFENVVDAAKTKWEIIRGTLNVSENNLPTKFSLKQNYPNPFNPNTKIKYEIAKSGFVSLKIYDVLGREIKTLVNENKNVGTYEIDFDANNLNSGIYFYKLTTNNFSEMKKMILVK